MTEQEPKPVITIILQNETIIKVDRICQTCGGKIDKYDKFTEEEHCENCGW